MEACTVSSARVQMDWFCRSSEGRPAVQLYLPDFDSSILDRLGLNPGSAGSNREFVSSRASYRGSRCCALGWLPK